MTPGQIKTDPENIQNYYPLVLNLSGYWCLVVGGGKVAQRKVLSLLECGANVRVVSFKLSPYLKKMADAKVIEFKQGEYHPSDLEGIFLVIAATDQAAINEKIADDCRVRNILVNVVNSPSRGNFLVPAVLRRGPLVIAVSTGGKSPFASRKIRNEIKALYGPEYEKIIELLGNLRAEILKEANNQIAKKKMLTALVETEDMFLLLKEGRYQEAKERIIIAANSCRG